MKRQIRVLWFFAPGIDAISRLSQKDKPAGPTIRSGKHVFSIDVPPRPSKVDQKEWPKGAMLSAYWWVSTTGEEDKANMIKTSISIDSFHIDVLKNCRAVQEQETLVWYKENKPVEKVVAAVRRIVAPKRDTSAPKSPSTKRPATVNATPKGKSSPKGKASPRVKGVKKTVN